jgi:hypothetical protein
MAARAPRVRTATARSAVSGRLGGPGMNGATVASPASSGSAAACRGGGGTRHRCALADYDTCQAVLPDRITPHLRLRLRVRLGLGLLA